MIRKPKKHPRYNIDLVGINFRERWNIVEQATEDEIQTYIQNFKRIREKNLSWVNKSWWERKTAVVNETINNIYLRKVWRKRHSETFKQDLLYRVDRTIETYSTKLGPRSGEGLATSWNFDRDRRSRLNKGDVVILTKVDELGNLYFSKINDIAAPHPFVFNRDNANLGFILPLES